jgi:HAD superfamily phosphatase (TIGR01668 family)
MIYASQYQLLQSLLTPNLVCPAIHDIPLSQLYDEGFQTLLLDVDNTLVGALDREATLSTANWIHQAKGLGYDVYIISNNRNRYRIERICTQLGLEGMYRALKPFPHALKEFAADRNINLRKSIMVGDQLFTDVIIGNWVRAYSVLVDPLDKKLSLFKTVQRELELFFLNRLTTKKAPPF